MINYKEAIDKELEELTFSEIKNRRSAMIKTRKKGSVLIAAALCAAMLCGITSVALGYYLDFEMIFGDYVKVDNSELADSLVGSVSNVRYKVSDSDYMITVKGAAGDKYNIIAVAEISRKDSTPVTEHLKNPINDDHISTLWNGVDITDGRKELRAATSFKANINDAGNIDLLITASGSRSIDRCRLKVMGKKFCLGNALDDFMSENRAIYDLRNNRFDWYSYYDEKGHATDIPAKVDDSSIMLLDLDWELDLIYNTSENALEKKICSEPEESFVFYQNIYENPESEPVTEENQAHLVSVSADAMRTDIKFTYPLKKHLGRVTTGPNEVYLIKKDGAHIMLTEESSCSGWGKDEIVECSMNFSYDPDYCLKLLTEISDVTSISINGTVYSLE